MTKYMAQTPFRVKLQDKVDIIVDDVPNGSLSEIYEFFCKFAQYMKGVSKDEFAGEADFIEKSSTRINCSMREVETNRLIAYIQVYKWYNYPIIVQYRTL